MTPEVLALAEAQAAQDRELLAALRLRDYRPPKRKVNLAIRSKAKKRRR